MASVSKLTCSSFAGAASLSSSASRSSEPKLSVCFRSRSPIELRSSSLGLSVRRNRSGGFSLIVKCSQDGNGSTTKRTTLHDLYESQGQSPWYDNLCRPVTDLLPLIASGVRGVTSNPTIFQKAISSSNAYDEQFRC